MNETLPTIRVKFLDSKGVMLSYGKFDSLHTASTLAREHGCLGRTAYLTKGNRIVGIYREGRNVLV